MPILANLSIILILCGLSLNKYLILEDRDFFHAWGEITVEILANYGIP